MKPSKKGLKEPETSLRETILKHVLKNAHDFGGKANSKVVLGLVLKEKVELRKDVPKVIKEIDQLVKEVELMKKEEIKKKLEKLAPELLTEKKEEKPQGPLKPLPKAENGKVIVRIAPSPSGPLHIGHAYGTSLNYEYARMYEGKFILRIEDTNPENIYPLAYKLIEGDVNWLTEGNISQVIVQSSRLGTYYDYAEKLVEKGKAYVCTCEADKWRKKKAKGEGCACRELGIKENQERYARMFSGYKEGESVLRLKTDIQDKNPALRDFGIMRIVEHVHPRLGKKEKVWPLMLFAVAVDDHELGITHVLNGKDHTDNAAKEGMIMNYFGWKSPEYQHWGRINFEGMKLSTSQTRLAIERGEYTGWDDIRLATLMALRRRGYQPEALRKFALEIGLSLTDKTVSKEEFFKVINAFNKEIIEPRANRYFFIDEPVEVIIEGAPKKEVEINLHPDFPERGKRKFRLGREFHLAQSDLRQLEENKLHRLMDAFNFTSKKGKFWFVSEDYEEYKNSEKKGSILHWLPAGENLKVEIMKEDGTKVSGIGESGLKKLKKGEIVQLERRYFAKLDKKEKGKLVFWYLHR